jgi:hypothetical protein
MKKILVLSLTLILSSSCFSQLGLEVFHFRPTGQLGDGFKPTFGGELSYLPAFESKMRFRGSIRLVYLKSRMDTIPIYAIEHTISGSTVLPGYQTFDKYQILTFSGGYDYSFIDGPFYPYVGGDIVFGGVQAKGESYVQQLSLEYYTETSWMIGVRPRIGVEYEVSDQLGLFANITRSWFMNFSLGFRSHNFNTFGLGARYQFN